MPRADPSRSTYCATRHLLRNLDDAAELRRNPLVRACFASEPAAGPDAVDAVDGVARVRCLVHATLARCGRRAGARMHGGLGRMHAALLRCDIDKQPLSVVAGELGLSDRQIRRERRAAHDAFLEAFRETASPGAGAPVAVCDDVGRLRLSRASELHELGESALAAAYCHELAASASFEHRVEALCLASEIERDAGRYEPASELIDRAHGLLAQLGARATPLARTVAVERIDLAAWSLRRALGTACALSMAAPLVTTRSNAAVADDEPRAALLVQALAAFAEQRWEVGDAAAGARAVRRCWELVPLLGHARTKERLAIMIADAHVTGLHGRDDHTAFLAAERLATRCGHVRSRIVARAERLGTEVQANGGGPMLDAAIGAYDAAQRRAMPWAIGAAALVAVQVESDPHSRAAAGDLAQRLLPPRSAPALLARSNGVRLLLEHGRYEGARLLAHAVRNDAEAAGNGRVRGAAAAYLARIALVQHRRRDARRHAGEALPLLDRYGTWHSRADGYALARELGLTASRTSFPANIPQIARG